MGLEKLSTSFHFCVKLHIPCPFLCFWNCINPFWKKIPISLPIYPSLVPSCPSLNLSPSITFPHRLSLCVSLSLHCRSSTASTLSVRPSWTRRSTRALPARSPQRGGAPPTSSHDPRDLHAHTVWSPPSPLRPPPPLHPNLTTKR